MAEAVTTKTTPDKGTTQVQERPKERPQSFAPSGLGADILALHDSAGNQAVSAVLRNGNGHPLDSSVRAFMESRFNHDFSQVRVHTDAAAAQSAESVHAKAYTVGQNIIFKPNAYTPETSTGQMLLAHELTHIIQQQDIMPGSLSSSPLTTTVNHKLEQEATQASQQTFAQAQSLSVAGRVSKPTIQRQPDSGSAAQPSTETIASVDSEQQIKSVDAPMVIKDEPGQGDKIIKLAKDTKVLVVQVADRDWRRIQVKTGPYAEMFGLIRHTFLTPTPQPQSPISSSGTTHPVSKTEYQFDPLEKDRERMPEGTDYKQDPAYVDNIYNTTYDVITGELWLNYTDAQIKMNYQQLKDSLSGKPPISNERYKKLLEDAQRHGITLPQGSQPLITVQANYFYRDKATGKIFPAAMSKGNLPNLADAVDQIEEARPEAEMLVKLGIKLLEIPIATPKGGPPKFAPSRAPGAMAARLALARAREVRMARETAQSLVKQMKSQNKGIIANIGGAGAKHEPIHAININNQAVSRKAIPNLVQTEGENIGSLFDSGQVQQVVGYRLSPPVFNWNQVATGSYRVLEAGGKFRIDFRWADAKVAKQLTEVLQKAGFKDVKNIGDTLITAAKP